MCEVWKKTVELRLYRGSTRLLYPEVIEDNCGGCFTHDGDKNPGGADGRRSVFPPSVVNIVRSQFRTCFNRFFACASKLHKDIIDVHDV